MISFKLHLGAMFRHNQYLTHANELWRRQDDVKLA
jgi:hypothetical protein